ncbi:hypothetical protein B0H13DRAFT_2354276 [Mycena leptocephala]|nr:hypothetical protein B0H13DRAFT_2354276 [Mycena leptocephala]
MQYHTSTPTASNTVPLSNTVPVSASTPLSNAPSSNPALTFAPVTMAPTAPRQHCPPNQCEICDAQHLSVIQQAHTLNGALTGPLPHRRTCRPTYYPDHPGIDVETHSLEAGKSFYVAIPAREEGIYTSSAVAREKSEGVHNGRHEAAKTYAEAKGVWALACLRWHGPECKRERLERLDARGKHWAVKGSNVICGSRAAAFRIAEDADLDDIHIRGHRDVNALFQWDVQWIEDQ